MNIRNINISIDPETNERIREISYVTRKTKKDVVKEAVDELYKNEFDGPEVAAPRLASPE